MITFEKFCSFMQPASVEKLKKFENSFYTMFKPGNLTVCTVGFMIEFKDEEYPKDEDWKLTEELVEIFKPLHAWIGTKENREAFQKSYPNITVEAYSFFEGSGFIPVAVIPVALL